MATAGIGDRGGLVDPSARRAYPLLAWRLGYLSVLLVPLISGEPRVNVVVAVALVIVFVAAGLLALTSRALVDVGADARAVWIWLGPRPWLAALATAALTAVTVALDARAASRRPATRSQSRSHRPSTRRPAERSSRSEHGSHERCTTSSHTTCR